MDSWSEIATDTEARWLQVNVPLEYSGGVSGLTETSFPCWNVGHFLSSGFIRISYMYEWKNFRRIVKQFSTTHRYFSLSCPANKFSGNFLMLLFPSHL